MKYALDSSATEDDEHGETTSKSDLQMSGTTTETGSFSEEESLFEAIGADFRTLALSLKETAGGVANFVQRSAMNVAAEIAKLEECDANDRSADSPQLRLPWEVRVSADTYKEDSQLKEKILALSSDIETFQPYNVNSDQIEFEYPLDEPRIQLIRRLLEIDDNLAAMHARLSGRSDVNERAFWSNYFSRCDKERREYLEEYGSELGSLPSQDSLVRADTDDSDLDDDDDDEQSSSSFVIPTPPASNNSTGSMVIIDAVNIPRSLS